MRKKKVLNEIKHSLLIQSILKDILQKKEAKNIS